MPLEIMIYNSPAPFLFSIWPIIILSKRAISRILPTVCPYEIIAPHGTHTAHIQTVIFVPLATQMHLFSTQLGLAILKIIKTNNEKLFGLIWKIRHNA